MIGPIYKLDHSTYTHDMISTGMVIHAGNDDYLGIGHDSCSPYWNTLTRFKIIEQIADETHEHLAVGPLQEDDTIRLEELHIIHTRIHTRKDVRVMNYTNPLIGLLSTITQPSVTQRFVPLQAEIIRLLVFDLRTHFSAHEGVAQFVLDFAERSARMMFQTLPPTMQHIYHLLSGRMDYYYDLLMLRENVDHMEQFLKDNMFFDCVKYPMGIAYRQIHGLPHGLQGTQRIVEVQPREVLAQDDHNTRVMMNPHLEPEPGGRYYHQYMRDSYLHLVDIAIHSRYSTFSITIDMLSAGRGEEYVKINYYHPGAKPDQNVGETCSIMDYRWQELGIDFHMLYEALIHIVEYLPIFEWTQSFDSYHITVCKTFNEILVFRVDVESAGSEEHVIQYLDIPLTILMTPALVLHNKVELSPLGLPENIHPAYRR